VPRHLYHFSPATLRAALQKCGFEIRSIRRFAKEQDPGGLAASLRLKYGDTDILPGNEPSGDGRRTALVRRMIRGALRRSIPLASRLAAAVGGSMCMEVYAIPSSERSAETTGI